MRPILSVCLLVAVTLPCHAQAKPNTLTPKEIADGWILLFDGETTFGWETLTGKVEGGALVIGGPEASKANVNTVFGEETEVVFECRGEGACGTFSSRPKGGNFGAEPGIGSPTEWRTRRVLLHAAAVQFSFLVDGQWRDGERTEGAGNVYIHRMYFTTMPGQRLELRNVKMKNNLMKPLFNGKDLTGWRVFPGDKYKSKFTVTDKGEINVTNGPGDLQTVGKFKDFVLQLECISNGKNLNSGIFFRCRDNEYQQGYEAQIRNQFTPEAKQDYTIEEYDPKTHKLLEKKKIKATAVDYGTGAIYRRVPARKEMSKDGEWFGMTIVAQGNHLATWVNGVQVTDWTDNRPLADNARKGCMLDAGHISIQGHDPTTNLSFRNLRIAELPAGK